MVNILDHTSNSIALCITSTGYPSYSSLSRYGMIMVDTVNNLIVVARPNVSEPYYQVVYPSETITLHLSDKNNLIQTVTGKPEHISRMLSGMQADNKAPRRCIKLAKLNVVGRVPQWVPDRRVKIRPIESLRSLKNTIRKPGIILCENTMKVDEEYFLEHGWILIKNEGICYGKLGLSL